MNCGGGEVDGGSVCTQHGSDRVSNMVLVASSFINMTPCTP